MKNLLVQVEEHNGVLVTTSNRVAEELGVRHDNLLSKIDEYIEKFNSPKTLGQFNLMDNFRDKTDKVSSAELSAQFYIPHNYKALNGRTVRNYLITEKGIAQLLGGYSSAVKIAFELNVAYINEFERMRKFIKESKNEISRKDLLKLNIINADTEMNRMVALNQYQVEYVKPLEIKGEYHDKVLDSDGTLTVREIAQDFGKTANWLNKVLNGLGVQFKQGKKWHLYSKYKDMGLVKEITILDEGNDKNYTRMKWTQKGREFIHKLLKDNEII